MRFAQTEPCAAAPAGRGGGCPAAAVGGGGAACGVGALISGHGVTPARILAFSRGNWEGARRCSWPAVWALLASGLARSPSTWPGRVVCPSGAQRQQRDSSGCEAGLGDPEQGWGGEAQAPGPRPPSAALWVPGQRAESGVT